MKLSLFNDEKLSDFLNSTRFREAIFPLYLQENEGEILANLRSEPGLVDEREIPVDFELPSANLLQTEADHHSTRKCDFDNIKRIYSALKNLPLALAAKPEFWGYLIHKCFFRYILKRSQVAKTRNAWSRKDVLRDFYCTSDKETPKRCIAMNPLARLWWAGRFSYDEQCDSRDPFLLARTLTDGEEFNSLMLLLCSSVQISHDAVVKGLLSAIRQWKESHGIRSVRPLAVEYGIKYLNSIGALRMIDSLTREEVSDLLIKNYQRNESELNGGDT